MVVDRGHPSWAEVDAESESASTIPGQTSRAAHQACQRPAEPIRSAGRWRHRIVSRRGPPGRPLQRAAQTTLPGVPSVARCQPNRSLMASTSMSPRPVSSSSLACRGAGAPGSKSRTKISSRSRSEARDSWMAARSSPLEASTALVSSSDTTTWAVSARWASRHSRSSACVQARPQPGAVRSAPRSSTAYSGQRAAAGAD
jgi:hypothetical protein